MSLLIEKERPLYMHISYLAPSNTANFCQQLSVQIATWSSSQLFTEYVSLYQAALVHNALAWFSLARPDLLLAVGVTAGYNPQHAFKKVWPHEITLVNLKFHQIKTHQMQKFANPPNLTATKFTRYIRVVTYITFHIFLHKSLFTN